MDVVAQLRNRPSVGVPELRWLLETATIGDSGSAGTLVPELSAARDAVGAEDAFDAASAGARVQLDGHPGSNTKPDTVLEVLERLLASWVQLGHTECALRAPGKADCIAGRVGLVSQARRLEVSVLCEALLERAVEERARLRAMPSMDTAVFEDRFQALCSDGWARTALAGLGVEVPGDGAAPRTQLSSAVGAAEASKPRQRSHSRGKSPRRRSSKSASRERKVSFKDSKAAVSADSFARQQSGGSTASGGAPAPGVATYVSSTMAGGGYPTAGAAAGPGKDDLSELWHAVHVGDELAVKRLITPGKFTARTTDAAGHSVFWHLIAWGHLRLALVVLGRFPFEDPAGGGPDVDERHKTRGDSLLHLVCRVENFGKDAAEILKRIATSAPQAVLVCRNASGETFLDVAAAALNFWVINFTILQLNSVAQTFLRGPPSHVEQIDPPLRSLARRIAKPRAPPAPELRHWPGHLELLQMLAASPATGSVPYADVAFEVSPGGSTGGGAAGGAKATGNKLVMAHRAIVASRSPVLLEELKRLPADTPLQGQDGARACLFRVDPRISKDVWKCVIYFLYSGEMHPSFPRQDPGQLLELLRACVTYQLPAPLADFAQACLCPLLPGASVRVALTAFSLSAGKPINPRLQAVRECSAYWVLRGAHELCDSMDAQDMASLLVQVLQAVEAAVFRGVQA